MKVNPYLGLVPDASDSLVLSPNGVRMLRLPEICRRTALSPSTIYALIACGQFPPLLKLARRARGLPAHVLDAWLWSRLLARAGMRTLRDPVVLPRWGSDPVVVSPVSDICMVRRTEVLVRVGLRKSALYEAVAGETFPAPAPVTVWARRWAAHEIQWWIDQCTARSLREAKRRLMSSTVALFPPPPPRLPSNRRSWGWSGSERRRT